MEAPLKKLKRLLDSKPEDMLGKKKDVATKMSGFYGRNSRPMLSHEEHKKHMEGLGKNSFRSKGEQEWHKKKDSLHIVPHEKKDK